MTTEQKKAKEKEYLEKYNIRVTYTDTPIVDNPKKYFTKKLARANEVLKKSTFS